jgi:Ulp1 protease family, C-terminal catalytic domain
MNSEDFVNQVIINISDAEPRSKADLQCAPGREFEAGSCISLVVLEEMAKAYNKMTNNEKDKIRLSKNMGTLNPQKYKLYLVHQIGDRLGDTCKTQKCWSTQDFIFQMGEAAKMELAKYTFRPDAPQGRFDWLSTFDINDSMAQYEKIYKGFKFYGANPMDFADLSQSKINYANYEKLYKEGTTKLGIIFNLDEHYKPGSHWVAMFLDLEKAEILYFDSFGVKPEKRIRALMRDVTRYFTDKRGKGLEDVRVDYNKDQHQKQNSECGVYSMNFLIRMARGDNFDKLCKDIIPDEKMNKCRKVYFDSYTKKND